ncbi:hypothetical protein [Bradyrhizobium ganzhouense]|uniref:hypothetical protein n=1 Tax=Bradyrhizobium ganzhouense TaxID=1179767 RepID=UPI003CEC5813
MLGFLPQWARFPIDLVARPAVGTSLLIIVVVELALGGNGYLVQLGPLRLRELLFVLCMIWSAAALLSRPEARPAAAIWGLLALFVAVTGFDVLLGFLNDNFKDGIAINYGAQLIVDPSPRSAVIGELKPLSYFAMLLFFVTAIRSRFQVTIVVTVLMLAGLLLATVYLFTLATVHLGLIPYATVYDHLEASDEFIFRMAYPGAPFVGFFYKGMYYACVAGILLMLDPFKTTKALALVVILAVGLALTRSLTVAVGACIVLGIAWGPWRQRALLTGQLLVLVVVAFAAFKTESTQLQAQFDALKNESTQLHAPERKSEDKRSAPMFDLSRHTDDNRLFDVDFVKQRLNPVTLVIGHGLGAKIGRRTKIELTYLEVLYKQGLVGLTFWLSLLAYCAWLYSRVPAANKTLGRALLLCSLFFFISTAANTVLTGSIGQGMVFIAIACLSVLAGESAPFAWYGYADGRPRSGE